MDKKEYKPKPFTQELAEQAYMDMMDVLDDKRTLCNVIKQAFRAAQEDSYNLRAVRDLLLESLWMGKRMHDKLYKKKLEELKNEQVEEHGVDSRVEIDWSKFDNFPAQGNWD
jgi:hypothetical protein